MEERDTRTIDSSVPMAFSIDGLSDVSVMVDVPLSVTLFLGEKQGRRR